jgi:hypothetical protein
MPIGIIKKAVPLQQPHVFLDFSGKGHYVGTVLQARGLEAGMTGFFEGDDSTVVDGVLNMHGTGSEDYFQWWLVCHDGPLGRTLQPAPFRRIGLLITAESHRWVPPFSYG